VRKWNPEQDVLQIADLHGEVQRIEPPDGLDERQCYVEVVARCVQIKSHNMNHVDQVLRLVTRHV
jgi:hypothetical protein